MTKLEIAKRIAIRRNCKGLSCQGLGETANSGTTCPLSGRCFDKRLPIVGWDNKKVFLAKHYITDRTESNDDYIK